MIYHTDLHGECLSLVQCTDKSKYRFGFIPLTDPILPADKGSRNITIQDPIALHNEVKTYEAKLHWD